MNARLIASIVAVVVVAGLLFGGGAVSGYMYCKSGAGAALVKQAKKDDKTVTKIEAKAEVRYVEVEKIKEVIKRIPDTTGCLDVPVPDAVNDKLLDAYNLH